MKIIALDIEATGPNPYRDRIIEIAMMLVLPLGSILLLNKLIKPDIPISPGATHVHGITDDDVKDSVGFGEYAKTVQEYLQDAVVLGYSTRAFDTVILDAELRRHGQSGIDLDTVKEIDLYRVLQEVEPRTLVGTVKRFLGKDHEGAHGALADTEVLAPVMGKMKAVFGIDLERMATLSKVDRSGKLRKNDEGVVCWNFGPYRGEPVVDHPDYIDWVLSRDFPESCKEALCNILEEMEAESEEEDAETD